MAMEMLLNSSPPNWFLSDPLKKMLSDPFR
jgi:hypothetical protein